MSAISDQLADSASLNKQPPLKLSKKLYNFILETAKKLNLNEMETFKIYFNLKKLKIKNLLEQNTPNLDHDDDVSNQESLLFKDILLMYNQERIATLNLITALFRACQDSTHTYYEIAQKITKSWLQNLGIKKKVLEDYVKICAITLPAELENYPEMAAAWTRQNLLEQKAFLELQIMIYYSHYPTPDETLQVIKSLVRLKLGSLQLNRPFFDRQGLEINREVEDLTSVFFVEVLNFQVALDRLTAPPSVETMLDRPESIAAANTLIWELVDAFRTTQDASPIGVVAIAWSCYMQFLAILLSQSCPANYSDIFTLLADTHPDTKSPQLLFQFGYQTANALEYLALFLSPGSYIQHDSNEMAYKSIVRELLNLLLVTQNVSYLPSRSKLILVFSSLFQRNSILCNHFWTLDFALESRASLLEAAQRSFPANFFDFVSLTTSLIAGADSADYACQFLSMMPSFCDYARGSDYEPSFEQAQGLNIWRWKGKCLVYGSPNFRICPALGTEAYEVGSNVLLVKYQYSAWHLFLTYLDSFLHLSDFEEHSNVHVGTVSVTAAILKLFNCVLENADDATRQDFLSHLANVPGNSKVYGEVPEELLPGIVGEIMNRCGTSKVPMMDVISECLQTVKFLLPHYPDIVWKRLRGSNLFPQYAYSTGTAGYFQTAILPLECASGKYPTTLSFLSLVKHIAAEAQKLNVSSKLEQDLAPATILYSCVFFILRDVFSTYSSWRFAQIHEKFQITHLVFETLDIIMQDSTWYHHEQQYPNEKNEVRLCSVTRLLLDTYVFSASNYQLSPLLDVIALGADGPNSFYKSNRKREALLLEQCMVSGLKLLKSFLLALTQYNHASGLESALLDRTVSTAEGPVEFIQIIASLIDYQNNSDFAQLATENLTLLCILSKKPGRPTTFFVGYFGAEAFSLVSKFVDLVRVQDQRAPTSPAIQCAVYSFITSVVDSQPGLGAMFLSGFEPKSITSKLTSYNPSDIPETSILFPLLGVLRKWKLIKAETPAILLSCLVLLDALWQSAPEHQSTIKLLRAQKEFWTLLLEILKEKVEPVKQVHIKDCSNWCNFISAQAYALRLLSVEVYLNFRSPKSVVDQEINKKIISALVEVLVTREIPMGQESLFHHPEYTEELQKMCGRLDSPLALDGYRRITWNDSIDSDRKFGASFVYSIPLLERKLRGREDEHAGLINQVKLVNMDWSFTDVEIVMLRACCFSTKLLTSGPWNSANQEKGVSNISKEGVFHLLKVVLKNLQKHTLPHYIHIDYKNELATLTVQLISYWLSLISQDDSDNVFLLLSMLQKATMTAHFPFGPVGTFSKYPFHTQLFSGMLLLIGKLSSVVTADWQKRIDALYQSVIGSLCEALANIMGGQSPGRNAFEESLVLSLLFEVTRNNSGASVSVWLPLFERYQIPSLLINAFSTWQPNSSGGVGGGSRENLCCLPEKVLELILSLSSHAPFAGIMISNGLIASLCNNSFSSEIMQGEISAYDGVDMRQIHQIWCLTVSIISELVPFAGGDGHTCESVVGFVCLYQNQITFALNSHLNHSLTVRSCWEVERILGLYCRLASVFSRSWFSNLNLAKFKDQVLSLLGLYVFLFKNPNELSHRIVAVSRGERVDLLEKKLFKNKIDEKMLSVAGYMVDFFLFYSAASKTLAVSGSDIDGQETALLKQMMHLESMDGLASDKESLLLFTASLTSFQEFGASFGTLFDLLRHFLSVLKREHVGKRRLQIIFNCESLIALVSAQLKLAVSLYSDKGSGDHACDELINEFFSLISDSTDLGSDDSGGAVAISSSPGTNIANANAIEGAKLFVLACVDLLKRSV